MSADPVSGGDGDREAALTIGRVCRERKARQVRVLYVGDRLGIVDWFVLATVNNVRQARAVRDAVRVRLKERDYGVPLSASEDPEGRWSLYDYGPVVLHLFDDEGRRYFDLDAMWADVPELPLGEDGPGARGEEAAGRGGQSARHEPSDDESPREAHR